MKLINYRKDGSSFLNLLLLQPVQDSNRVCRFCLGLQIEVNEGVVLADTLAAADCAPRLLPYACRIDYCAERIAHVLVEDERPLNDELWVAPAGLRGQSRVHAALFTPEDVEPSPVNLLLCQMNLRACAKRPFSLLLCRHPSRQRKTCLHACNGLVVPTRTWWPRF